MTIALRRLEPQDDDELRVLFDDADTRRWNPGPDDGDIEKWRLANIEWTDFRVWAVVDATDTLVGLVSVFGIDEWNSRAEIGFRISPTARGRGVARAAVELACLDVAADGGIHRLTLYHAIANVASCRVAEATGFALDATLLANYRYGDGVLHDEHVHVRDFGRPDHWHTPKD